MSEFGEKTAKIADKVTKEAVRLGDTATLSVKLKRSEIRTDSKYRELGKLTYRHLRYDEENAEKIDGILAEIDGLLIEQDNIRRELDELKINKE